VLRLLASEFESCMLALNYVRRELEAYGTVEAQTVRKLLEN
jgi:hypothetical protein